MLMVIVGSEWPNIANEYHIMYTTGQKFGVSKII